MSQATWYIGDAMKVLATLPDASVDLVMTSPPFLALRSYLPADHESKALEIGSEATPGAFLDVLLDVTEELARVLAPHGSLVVELGDTYSGSGGAGGDYNADGWRDGENRFNGAAAKARAHAQKDRTRNPDVGWPLAKSLCMIPSSYAWALAYGRNPWTGRTTPPWRVRNLIAWCRPNPPVGALGDKFRPGTSYLTVACKSASRYFDLDAVREPAIHAGAKASTITGLRTEQNGDSEKQSHDERSRYEVAASAPPLDWWEIPTHPYPGSHYATFPPELCVRPIKAMCPQKVCRVCGKPSERITGPTTVFSTYGGGTGDGFQRVGLGASELANAGHGDRTRMAETVGWSDCGCCPRVADLDRGDTYAQPCRTRLCACPDKWRNGIVLDPFAGSGTTLAVATGHGRDAIGIDLDPRNYELARQRIGMFLTEAVA